MQILPHLAPLETAGRSDAAEYVRRVWGQRKPASNPQLPGQIDVLADVANRINYSRSLSEIFKTISSKDTSQQVAFP